MQKFEKDYFRILDEILESGEVRQTRNAKTISSFGKTLVIDELTFNRFPLLQSRKSTCTWYFR